MTTSVTGPAELSRHLPFPGTHNFRDAGGYVTQDGGAIRWRTLFRSDSLHRIDAPVQQELVSLGVRTVMDLRHVSEAERMPNAFQASGEVCYLHRPLAPYPTVKRLAETLEELNRIWLDDCQDQIRQIIEGLGTQGAFPSIIHCSIGKDRTGLVVALLLRLAGVLHETVVEDYALSGLYAAPAIAEYREHLLQNGAEADKITPMLECRAEVMASTLEHVDAAYGGVGEYVAGIGVPEQTVEAVRGALVCMDHRQ